LLWSIPALARRAQYLVSPTKTPISGWLVATASGKAAYSKAFSDRNGSERNIDHEKGMKTLHPSRGLEYADRARMAKTEIPDE
jgi:hypothetical protein